MKVYFNASLAGKLDYLAEYKKIISILKKTGHEVIADHVINRDFAIINRQTNVEHSRDFQRARKSIQQSDVMIVEGTYPSIGVGLLIGLALDMYKPVLILYLSTPHGLLLGDPNRLLTVASYTLKKEKELESKIKSFMKRAENKMLKLRFNLLINYNQNHYLEWIAIKNRISKAEFIRKLVDGKITNDLKYREVVDYKEGAIE